MPTQQQMANAIRALSMDAVQLANSGHPGMPMGMADMAEVLWREFLNHNPKHPSWSNRDRFVLSNGHGSMLLYALLHLSGYDLSIDDLKQFRQLHSKTPGHPELDPAIGIETTTGPLGQGLANAVGLALAENTLAAEFNQDDFNIVDHYTYVFTGDGCLMEGISHEVCSLAGTLGLGKLIVLYDDNGISIDGDVSDWYLDDTAKRFEAYRWHVISDVDGHDPDAIRAAIAKAKAVTDKPSLIQCKTIIGFGAPTLAGSEKSHGAPLGDSEIEATRKALGWSHPAFEIPNDIKAAWDACEKGAAIEQAWQTQFDAYKAAHPNLAAEYERRMSGQLPTHWQDVASSLIQGCHEQAESIASRKASLNVLNAIAEHLPELMGGSADLTGSNLTRWQAAKAIKPGEPDGNYIHYGVREFGMSAMMNGLALHGGFIPFGGTFLVFSDYARSAVRLAAIMQQRVIFVYSHDSIGLGEDGPTHQPIEHAASLRLIPNMSVWRPCDTVESAVAWTQALENASGPSALLFSRQSIPYQTRDEKTLANVARGGYILAENAEQPDVILIATGSEVGIAKAAYEHLVEQGVSLRLVSMPSTDAFDRQDKAYREAVLPSHVTARIAIEAGAKDYWYKYVGLNGKIVGLDCFGESAPIQDVYQSLGITSEAVIQAVSDLLGESA